jgi:hypothetical protein
MDPQSGRRVTHPRPAVAPAPRRLVLPTERVVEEGREGRVGHRGRRPLIGIPESVRSVIDEHEIDLVTQGSRRAFVKVSYR